MCKVELANWRRISREDLNWSYKRYSVFPPTSNKSIVTNNNDQGIGLEEGSTSRDHSHNSSNTTNGETSEEVTPVSKVRSLRELHESYSYAFIFADLITFEEAITKEEWQQAMK